MAQRFTTSRSTWAPGSLPLEDADVQLSLSARPENVAVVRHVMGAFGDVLELPTRTIEDVRLAVTEACTNVVRHAYDERGGRMEISVAPHRDHLEIAVADTGRGIAPSTDRVGPGLGLPMMATLADTLEIDRTVHAGSRVTMTFARDPARAA
jgi:serine/threonine-protein kinase RsbW